MGGYYINTFSHHHSPQESYKNCWFLVVAKYRKLKEYRSVSTAQVNVDLRLIAIKNTIQGRMITIWLSFTDCKKNFKKPLPDSTTADARRLTIWSPAAWPLRVILNVKANSSASWFMRTIDRGSVFNPHFNSATTNAETTRHKTRCTKTKIIDCSRWSPKSSNAI